MDFKNMLGLAFGTALIYGIFKLTQTGDNRQIHISQTQTANNAGYVFYNNKYYDITEMLSYTENISLSAYQAQQEIAANSSTGQILTLSIMQIDRLKTEEEEEEKIIGEKIVVDGM